MAGRLLYMHQSVSWKQVGPEHRRTTLVWSLPTIEPTLFCQDPSCVHHLCFPLSRFTRCRRSSDSKISGLRGKTERKMSCNPEKGHTFVCWYQQKEHRVKYVNQFSESTSFGTNRLGQGGSLQSVPQTHPADWKFSPQEQETRHCTSEPAACLQS